MNYKNYIAQIQDALKAMSESEKDTYILNLAKREDDEKREAFLKDLKTLSHVPFVVNDPRDDLIKMMNDVLDDLTKIDNEEIYVTVHYHFDEYEYDDDFNEVETHDYEVKKVVEKVAHFLQKCVIEECYDLGLAMVKRLSTLYVMVDADGQLNESFWLKYASDQDQFEQCLFDITRCILKAGKQNEIGSLLKPYIKIQPTYELDHYFSKYFSVFKEDQDHNVHLLIETFCDKPGEDIKRILNDLFSLLKDDVIELASKYGKVHPFLYVYALEHSDDHQECLNLGNEALRILPQDYQIREKIALATYKHARALNIQENEYLVEAFLSVPTVCNYFRMLYYVDDLKPYENKIKRRLSSKAIDYNCDLGISYLNHLLFDETKEDDRFLLKEDSCHMLHFLRGDLTGQHIPSFFFNHIYVIEFLLTALANDSRYLKKGYQSMIDELCPALQLNPKTFFIDDCRMQAADFMKMLIERWKTTISITPEIEAFWLEQCERTISKFTESTLSKQQRDSYNQCAYLIAALGEVEESRGITNARQTLMQEYKKKYSRFSRFRAELKKFGMTSQRSYLFIVSSYY